MLMKSDEEKVKMKDYYFETKINEYKVMKPKKISNSEHRKRKRKKPESKERKRVNAKTRKMSFLVILLRFESQDSRRF